RHGPPRDVDRRPRVDDVEALADVVLVAPAPVLRGQTNSPTARSRLTSSMRVMATSLTTQAYSRASLPRLSRSCAVWAGDDQPVAEVELGQTAQPPVPAIPLARLEVAGNGIEARPQLVRRSPGEGGDIRPHGRVGIRLPPRPIGR